MRVREGEDFGFGLRLLLGGGRDPPDAGLGEGTGLDPPDGLGVGLEVGVGTGLGVGIMGVGLHCGAAQELSTGRVSCAKWKLSERVLALRTAMGREPACMMMAI